MGIIWNIATNELNWELVQVTSCLSYALTDDSKLLKWLFIINE